MQYGCNSFLGFLGVMLAARIHHLLEGNVPWHKVEAKTKCSAHNCALHMPTLRTDPPYGNGVTPDQWLIAARLLITCG